jgi:hypothetical protein
MLITEYEPVALKEDPIKFRTYRPNKLECHTSESLLFTYDIFERT